MKRTWWAALGFLALSGCTDPGAPAAASASAAAAMTARPADGGSMKSAESADARLRAFADKFLGEYLERNPTRATEAGEHRHDGRWPDLSERGEAAERTFIQERLRDLA